MQYDLLIVYFTDVLRQTQEYFPRTIVVSIILQCDIRNETMLDKHEIYDVENASRMQTLWNAETTSMRYGSADDRGLFLFV